MKYETVEIRRNGAKRLTGHWGEESATVELFWPSRDLSFCFVWRCLIYRVCLIQNYRYEAQPTEDGVANGKKGKGKKNRKDELENLKREVEMVNNLHVSIV